ncbi:hypothetical protein H4W32_007870 [Actinophytocola algeriensis]|uniref:Uncharacterized protein n=1 Tax=Actinophytocola algeriensis TaxID=1768010 RepID=A0A7W7VF00_9PSEU|nr:hypothetical protein [Actinophytocola algeriensis]MBE1479828.1 hypothetical protein [Actinophytocola algeriensis]
MQGSISGAITVLEEVVAPLGAIGDMIAYNGGEPLSCHA